MINPDITNNLIAGLALIASLIAIGLNVRSERRQRKFNETTERLNALQIEREQADAVSNKAADLSANFVQTNKHTWRLRIFNRGQRIARNIRVEFSEGGDLFDQEEIARKFRYPSLDVHQSTDLLAAIFMSSETRATVRLLWDDDAGGGNKTITADAL